MPFLKLVAAAATTIAVYGVLKAIVFFTKPWRSYLRSLPGPKNASFLWGNMKEIQMADNQALHDQWVKEYGTTFKYKGFFMTDRLCTMDLRALNHILTHSTDYQKPAQARYNLSRLLGNGILITEGEKHKQQRRIMNPSFGPSSIRDLTPIFFRKAMELRDIWASEVDKSTNTNSKVKIEVLSWLSRTTLDVIGLAGFNYKFNALEGEANELNRAFSMLFHADGRFNLLMILQAFLPIFRIVPSKRDIQQREAQSTMLRIGKQLLQERKNLLLGEKGPIAENLERDTADLGGRDLLTALVKANLEDGEGTAEDVEKGKLPAGWDREGRTRGQRMSDEDVIAQVPTFLVAGHETTSTETMWALYSLSLYPEFQRRLRAELLACPTPTPSMDTLVSLPYLDAVVRETMRLHAAVPSTIRVAVRDDVIPLADAFVDKRGVRCDSIKIKKGEGVFIPILSINRSAAIWGKDAHEYNPDRWFNLPDTTNSVPGVWGNMLTFLGGARSCIGYRFALIEMKALLFTLIRSFEFELSVPPEDIEKRSMVVTRPYLKSERDKGAQMPLYVRKVVVDEAEKSETSAS